MAWRIGNMRRIFENLKNSIFSAKQKDKFVGSDQYGNNYFEKGEDSSHNLRASRYIKKEFDPDFTIPKIPVEWEAWLRGRRDIPPTPEEIERNYIRMMQTKIRAEELDRKHLAEKETANSCPTPLTITEDIKPNHATSSFPKYEGFESAPGENINKLDKVK
ncbi:unnamed protein product [Lymnaea stagnalis]|uniref:NADH dehydrogenase [ubiquinone] 1 alpha subcomplex assembly factor 2 n=1 Tax=Lymnaea stagnalis TaxID=6523 RepID=A0AAV2IMU6_LYMST